MKAFQIFKARPRLWKSDWWMTILPAALWAIGYFVMAPFFHSYQCQANPSLCNAADINSVDQIALKYNWEEAHAVSNLTQNSAGYVSVALPLIFHGSQMIAQAVNPALGWSRIGTDIVIMLQTAFWNGAFTHLAKATTQRPRPYVYSQVRPENANVQAYLSFYSGHTSFTGSMAGAQIFMLMGYGVRRRWIWAIGTLGVGLSIATGVLRVLAGQHYVSDVGFGFVSGILVAYWIARIHRKGV